MNEHLPILKRVGKVLIIIGLVDIAVMIYCIANSISYSSSFNIFAVIAGVFLYRGSLRTAVITTWLSSIFIVMLAGLPWASREKLTNAGSMSGSGKRTTKVS